MKKFLWTLLMLSIATSSFAYSKIGFRAYSSATAVSCAVVGGTQAMNNRQEMLDSFNPVISTARVYLLGTKGFANYSATGLSVKQAQIYCFATLTPTNAAVVKMFFDGAESRFFPLSSMFLFVAP
jgi:hypothetical protein